MPQFYVEGQFHGWQERKLCHSAENVRFYVGIFFAEFKLLANIHLRKEEYAHINTRNERRWC